MINYLLHGVVDVLVCILVIVQVFDIHSTILALRLPWVQEVGDEAIGLGNLSGWCQRHLGSAWWVIKTPFLTFLPILWTPIDTLVMVPLIMLLILANGYFWQITLQNYDNANSQPPVGWQPESPTHSRRTP